MEFMYVETLVNGVVRITEKNTVVDGTPGASPIDVGDLLNVDGFECWRMVDGIPTNVGPRPMTATEVDALVEKKLKVEYPQEKINQLNRIVNNSLLEGKPSPAEYKKYTDREKAIKTELEADNIMRTY